MRKFGSQEPTFKRVGEHEDENGLLAIDVIEDMGAEFMPYQKDEFCLFMARNAKGDFASRSIGISIPRQNGKSFAARWYAIWMAAVEGQNVLYSCHHSKVARSMFKKIKDSVLASPDLRMCLKPNKQGIYQAQGNEGLYFADPDTGLSRGMIEFQTRMNGNVRGESYAVIVVDEAQELTDAQSEGMTPTRLAQADPQTIYIGTPTPPECNGTVFARMHDAAHNGTGRSWWIEWAVDSIVDTGDEGAVLEAAYLTNPAMGYLIREDVMLDTVEGMSQDGASRELFGWWSPSSGKIRPLINEKAWDALSVDGSNGDGKRAFAVKFSPDGAEAVLAVAAMDGEKVHVEVVERMTMAVGLGWIAEYAQDCKSSARCFVVDGKAHAGNLVEKLGKMPVGYIVTPTAAQVVTACSAMVDAVAEKRVTWLETQQDLRDSAVTSVRRSIGSGGGWGFGGENPVPIEAVSLALWGVLNSKRDPERKMRIG